MEKHECMVFCLPTEIFRKDQELLVSYPNNMHGKKVKWEERPEARQLRIICINNCS